MEGGALCWLPSSSHHPNANKPAMQPTAITIRPLIMVNVSSLTLNIPHLHRDTAGDQPDCRRLGSRFLWLRCNEPIFYCGKEMAETRRWQGLRVDHGDCAARGLAAGPRAFAGIRIFLPHASVDTRRGAIVQLSPETAAPPLRVAVLVASHGTSRDLSDEAMAAVMEAPRPQSG
jgi:hypothetical protein